MALTDAEKDLESGLEALDNSVSRHRNGAIRLAIAGIFLLIASLNFGGGAASASTYGSSGYGGCTYDTDCVNISSDSTSITNDQVAANQTTSDQADQAKPASSATSKAPQTKSQTIWGTLIKLISSVAAITISAYEFIVLGRTHHM